MDFANPPLAKGGEQLERMVLCIDVSTSMGDDDYKPSRIRGAQDASIALFEKKYRLSADDEIGVVAFSSGARIVCPLLPMGIEVARIKQAIQDLKPSGSTSISVGLRKSGKLLLPHLCRSWLDRFMGKGRGFHERGGRALRIILLSDGEDNDSMESPVDVARDLKNQGVTIDCIGIGKRSEVNEPELKAIASIDTDGVTPRYAFIGDSAELLQKFEELAGHITR